MLWLIVAQKALKLPENVAPLFGARDILMAALLGMDSLWAFITPKTG